MKNILLVFGGKSYEHDISVVTAFQIYNKTRLEDVNLVLFYVSRENKFFIYKSEKCNLNDFSKSSNIEKNKKFKEVVFVTGENNRLFLKTRFGLKEYLTADYAIFACHGSLGENGKLVSFFEQFNIYSSVGNFDSLAICMNKFLFKQVMKGVGVPVVRGFKINKLEFEKNKENVEFMLRMMKFPVVIKANSGGSSIGVFVSKTLHEFYENINDAFEFDNEVLVEKLVNNAREFNIAILGTQESFEVSEIDEPIKEHDVLTFADKYLSSSVKKSPKLDVGIKNSMAGQQRKMPADINEKLRLKINELAIKIFKSLNLSGVIRIDFLFDEENNKLYVCEVNAIPGSLAFYFFKGNSILTNRLVMKLIDVAKSNKELSNNFKIEFSTNVLE